MAGKPVIREVKVPEDLRFLARHMRAADRAEIVASNGPDVYSTLCSSIALSDRAMTVERDGVVVCIFGNCPTPCGGVVWALGTPELDRLGRALTRVTRRFFDHLLTEFPRVFNYVDARNTRAIAWLKMIGCTIHDPEPHGVSGLPFHYFEKAA